MGEKIEIDIPVKETSEWRRGPPAPCFLPYVLSFLPFFMFPSMEGTGVGLFTLEEEPVGRDRGWGGGDGLMNWDLGGDGRGGVSREGGTGLALGMHHNLPVWTVFCINVGEQGVGCPYHPCFLFFPLSGKGGEATEHEAGVELVVWGRGGGKGVIRYWKPSLG